MVRPAGPLKLQRVAIGVGSAWQPLGAPPSFRAGAGEQDLAVSGIVNVSLTMRCHRAGMTTIDHPAQWIDLESPTVLRSLLRHIVEHADVAGIDAFGRPVLRFEFACEHWLLDKLAALGATAEDMEDDDPLENDDPAEDIDAVLA